MSEDLPRFERQRQSPRSVRGSWRTLVRRIDSLRGVGTLRTLRGLDSWVLRWTFIKVLAIEPLPDNYRALEHNIAINDLQRKIRPFNVAAGAAQANGTMFVKADDTSSLAPVEGATGTLGVSIRPLDEILSDEGIPASEVRLLKADVEGYELAVLEGARRLLVEGSPIVVLEANTAAARGSLETYMGRIGYELVRTADGRNLFFERFL